MQTLCFFVKINLKGRVMRKRHFKFFTFLSGLVEVALGVGALILSIFLIFSSNGFFGSLTTSLEGAFVGIFFGTFLLILVWVVLICLFIAVIICLALGIMLISASFKEDRIFEKRRGFIIFTIVADIFLFSSLIAMSTNTTGTTQSLIIMVAVLMALTAILKITDLIINKTRVAKLEKIQEQNGEAPKRVVDFSALGGKFEDKENAQSKKDELQKLEEMKNNGLIDEKEYEQRKNEIKEEK